MSWPSLSEVLNGIPVGVLILDKKGAVIAINDLLAGWLGIAAEDIRGRAFNELPCFRGHSAFKSLFLMLEAGREGNCIVHDSRFAVSVRPLHGEQGEVAGAMLVFEDKGYCRELEQAVIKAERLAILGQLCAITMHEIKNPLAAVRGYLQLFKRELKDPRRAARVDIMLAAVDRVSAIIADFLRLARPAVPKRRPCKLRSVIEKAMKLLEGEAKRCGIRFFFSYDESLPQFILDEEQFEQVLLNVFKNACEAMPGGGEVAVRVTADPSAALCRIEVEDTGPGMTEEQRRRAFEPYFTTKESGTGLGLYISRLIVRNHGGDMMIENRPNEGCRVVILLPVVESSGEEGLA